MTWKLVVGYKFSRTEFGSEALPRQNVWNRYSLYSSFRRISWVSLIVYDICFGWWIKTSFLSVLMLTAWAMLPAAQEATVQILRWEGRRKKLQRRWKRRREISLNEVTQRKTKSEDVFFLKRLQKTLSEASSNHCFFCDGILMLWCFLMLFSERPFAKCEQTKLQKLHSSPSILRTLVSLLLLFFIYECFYSLHSLQSLCFCLFHSTSCL